MRTRDTLRRVAWQIAPAAMADRAHRYQLAMHDRWGLTSASETVVAEAGTAVVRGPFAGLQYPTGRPADVSKRVGAYECELHSWFDEGLAAGPSRFIDIGAADGFYAVAVALRGVPVEAFEMARSAREEIDVLAALNEVPVTIHGRATPASLSRLDFAHALVLCDCEGAEIELLAPPLIARLASATVIVEVHEAERPGAQALLRERFAASHDADVVLPVKRDVSSYPELSALDPVMRSRVLGEGRVGETPWLRLRPKR